MTAISFNLTPSKSIDVSGLPLEGLPPLEAGRTLPDAFAELLGKASKAAGKPAVEGDTPGEPKAAEADIAADGDGVEASVDAGMRPTAKLVPPVPSASSNTTPPDGEPLPPGQTEAESGKDLPPARSEIAAASAAPSTAAPIPQPAKAARGTPAPQTSKANPGATRSEPVTPEVAAAVKERAGSKPKEARPADPEIEPTDQATGAPAIADPFHPHPEGEPLVDLGINAAGLQQGKAASDPAAGPSASNTPSAATPTAFTKAESAASQTAQQFLGGDGAPRGEGKAQAGDAQAEPSSRQASQSPANASAAQPAKVATELPQTGLSLQLRAADKPVAADRPMIAIDASQPGGQTANGASPVQGIAAPVGHTPFATPMFGSAPQTGALPHFPDLAGLVDRIAAARSSAGSASATIAVAHKELGNLSLTFEATGNTLDVEVAAQDSDTQRSLAAAIAADRPHLRPADAQAQAPGQTLHSQLASSAHGGGTDARQSGMAGDAQSDRRGDTEGGGRGTGRQGNPGSTQGRPDQKSDGGIYA